LNNVIRLELLSKKLSGLVTGVVDLMNAVVVCVTDCFVHGRFDSASDITAEVETIQSFYKKRQSEVCAAWQNSARESSAWNDTMCKTLLCTKTDS
jgi:hypothetical protein